jgi:hypothetical protein
MLWFLAPVCYLILAGMNIYIVCNASYLANLVTGVMMLLLDGSIIIHLTTSTFYPFRSQLSKDIWPSISEVLSTLPYVAPFAFAMFLAVALMFPLDSPTLRSWRPLTIEMAPILPTTAATGHK